MRHTPFYRIAVILLCYAIVGLFVFVPLAQDPNKNLVVLIVVGSVFFLAFLATVIVEEVIRARKKKAQAKEEEPHE